MMEWASASDKAAGERSKVPSPAKVADIPFRDIVGDVLLDAAAVQFRVKVGQFRSVGEDGFPVLRPGHVLPAVRGQFFPGVRVDVGDKLIAVHWESRRAE